MGSPHLPSTRGSQATRTTEQLLSLALPKADVPHLDGKISLLAEEGSCSHQQPDQESCRAPDDMAGTQDRYRILQSACCAVADHPSVRDVLHSLRRVLSNISCVYSAGLYLLTENRKGLKLFANDRDADDVAVPIGIEVPCTHAFARVVEKQERVYVPDLAQEMLKLPELAPFASRVGVRRAYLFPVATSRNEYGVVAFTSEQGRDFSKEDVELMGSLASHIAVAVENGVYQQQLAEEGDRLRALQDDLQRSQANLAEAQRLSHTGSWAFDVASDKYIYLSEECLRIFELDAQESLPTREGISRLIHRKDWDEVQRDFEKLLREKVDTSTEFRVTLPSGTIKYIHAIRHLVLNDAGDVVQVVGTVVDITERKRAENELRRSEAYLSEAERLSHTGTWAVDGTGQNVYWSPEVFRIWGFDPQRGLPTRHQAVQRIHPEDLEKYWKYWQAVCKPIGEKIDLGLEFRIVLPGGTVRHLHGLAHPILNGNGDVVEIVGATVDITERKRAENELRRSEAELGHERDRLSLLLEINNHIVSKLEASELFQAVAASMCKHLGYDAVAFWLINNKSGCLESKYLDFPTGKGFLEKVAVTVPTNLASELWRLRRPQIYSPQDVAALPPALREALQAESLLSHVSVPLVGTKGPLGILNIRDRKTNAFSEGDLDLLSHIGIQISLALDNALAYGRLCASRDDVEAQRLFLESEISSECNFYDIVGNSASMKRVFDQIAIVAATNSTVLLHGETGTGKELIARAIHNLSSRRDRAFVRMNCAAIPSGLLESELFGHEKGAFTGALMQKKGRFELADHSSLFLDEIGDISLELQPKLLRAVQEQEFERLGSARTIHVDVRMIAATHRDLPVMIREGKFREDLFYRLNVFPIEIPPLRDRRGDIPLLVTYFVSKLSRRMGKKIKSIPKQVMEFLANASWPGNVRELQNFIERAVILTQGGELYVPISELQNRILTPRSIMSTFHDAERQAIINALKAASGRIAGVGGAAERLGLKRTTLQNKMHRLQITRSDYLLPVAN